MHSTKGRSYVKRKTFGKQYKKKVCDKFISNIKRQSNAGNYGRGTHIEEEHFQYFLVIVEELQKPARSYEERVSMATNVLEETRGQEIHLASNQLVSNAIEALIGFAGEDHFERFIDVFGENFRPICSDTFASHVIQKMIDIAFLRAFAEHKIEDGVEPKEEPLKKKIITDQKYNMETKFSINHQEKCKAFVERISKFLLNNLEDFALDTFASFVIRSCIYALAGINIPKVEKKNFRNKDEFLEKATLFETPETWKEILKEFPSRLQMWPQFPDLVYSNSSSPMLEGICRALGKVEKNALKHFGKNIIKGAFFNVDAAKRGYEAQKDVIDKKETGLDCNQNDQKGENVTGEYQQDNTANEEFPPVFWSFTSVRLLECLINTAGPKLYNNIYKTLFEGRFPELVMNRISWFAAKVMLRQLKDKTLFETIFDQLVKQFDRFIDHSGVSIFPEISNVCLRLNTKQAAFITALQSSLHCTTAHGTDRPNSFLMCLLQLTRFEDLGRLAYGTTTGFGSAVAQNILQFKKPIFLVNCILDSYPKELLHIITSPPGSFIGDAFFKSKFIGEKSREKFVKMLDGLYLDLALSKFGSRVLESMFHVGNETQKFHIAKELMSRENKLKGALSGRIIYHKLRLQTFRMSAERWKASWNVKDLKEDELNSIVKIKKTKRRASTSEEKCELKKKK